MYIIHKRDDFFFFNRSILNGVIISNKLFKKKKKLSAEVVQSKLWKFVAAFKQTEQITNLYHH